MLIILTLVLAEHIFVLIGSSRKNTYIKCQGFAKLSPSPSPSWVELVIISAFPATWPPTHLKNYEIGRNQYNSQNESFLSNQAELITAFKGIPGL